MFGIISRLGGKAVTSGGAPTAMCEPLRPNGSVSTMHGQASVPDPAPARRRSPVERLMSAGQPGRARPGRRTPTPRARTGAADWPAPEAWASVMSFPCAAAAGSSFRPCGSRFPAADSPACASRRRGAHAGAALVRQTDAAEGIDDAGVANLLVTGIEQLLARGEGVGRD